MAVAQATNNTERNKMIIAIVLGSIALFALFYAFSGSFFSSSSTRVSVTTTTPSPTRTPARNVSPDNFQLPTADQQAFNYESTPISYSPVQFSAPDPGRNIFAFYEPPPPCTPGVNCPPPPPVVVRTPTPEPPPPVFVAYVTPQSVYEGSRAFKMDVFGDKFEPSTKIYINGVEFPTSYISPQRLTVDVPANMLTGPGSLSIIVKTPDGRLYSNPVMLSIQAKPLPQFKFIGMIGRQHANNDTAYILEQGKTDPTTWRLNDVVGNRFRIVSISPADLVVEDTGLGFRHSIKLEQPTAGTPVIGAGVPSFPGRGGFPGGFNPNPGTIPPGANMNPPTSIPGIPDNIPRVNSPANANTRTTRKDDDSDDDGTDNRKFK